MPGPKAFQQVAGTSEIRIQFDCLFELVDRTVDVTERCQYFREEEPCAKLPIPQPCGSRQVQNSLVKPAEPLTHVPKSSSVLKCGSRKNACDNCSTAASKSSRSMASRPARYNAEADELFSATVIPHDPIQSPRAIVWRAPEGSFSCRSETTDSEAWVAPDLLNARPASGRE